MTGTLHGVGLGPGAPDLMTIRAHRLIAGAEVIAYPALPGEPSLARSIAAGAIPAGAEEIRIETPMTRERAPAQAAYDRAAERIGAHLEAGRDVVALCEGDPFFYGSFMYLHARLAPRYPCEVTPGVSSLGACAAAAGRPLAARDETLTVIPAPLPDAEIEARLKGSDAAAVVKLGRHMPRLRALLARLGLSGAASYVARASLAGEQVAPLAEAPAKAPYFSMILVRKGGDPWLD